MLYGIRNFGFKNTNKDGPLLNLENFYKVQQYLVEQYLVEQFGGTIFGGTIFGATIFGATIFGATIFEITKKSFVNFKMDFFVFCLGRVQEKKISQNRSKKDSIPRP